MINIQFCDKNNLFEVRNLFLFLYFVINVFLKIFIVKWRKVNINEILIRNYILINVWNQTFFIVLSINAVKHDNCIHFLF